MMDLDLLRSMCFPNFAKTTTYGFKAHGKWTYQSALSYAKQVRHDDKPKYIRNCIRTIWRRMFYMNDIWSSKINWEIKSIILACMCKWLCQDSNLILNSFYVWIVCIFLMSGCMIDDICACTGMRIIKEINRVISAVTLLVLKVDTPNQ